MAARRRPRAVAYLRVSTDRQADLGLGLEVQEEAIRTWAKDSGHRIVGWHRDEGVSGANGIQHREALPEALNAIRHGDAEVLVVANLDRLARKLEHQEAILARVWAEGGRVVSIGDGGEVLEDDPDDPMRKAIRQMRGVFSELERNMIAKRLREGRQRRDAEGGYAYGAPPYGWRPQPRKDGKKGKELVPDPDEHPTLSRMMKLRRAGQSLRQIADALNAEGVPPPYGPSKKGNSAAMKEPKWHPNTVARILKREEERRRMGGGVS